MARLPGFAEHDWQIQCDLPIKDGRACCERGACVIGTVGDPRIHGARTYNEKSMGARNAQDSKVSALNPTFSSNLAASSIAGGSGIRSCHAMRRSGARQYVKSINMTYKTTPIAAARPANCWRLSRPSQSGQLVAGTSLMAPPSSVVVPGSSGSTLYRAISHDSRVRNKSSRSRPMAAGAMSGCSRRCLCPDLE